MSRRFTRWAMLALALLVFALSIFSGLESKRVVNLEAKVQQLKKIQVVLIKKMQPPEKLQPSKPERLHKI